MNTTTEPEPIEDVENNDRNEAEEKWDEEGLCPECGEPLDEKEEECPECIAIRLNI